MRTTQNGKTSEDMREKKRVRKGGMKPNEQRAEWRKKKNLDQGDATFMNLVGDAPKLKPTG